MIAHRGAKEPRTLDNQRGSLREDDARHSGP